MASLVYHRIIEHADSRHVNLTYLYRCYDPDGTGSLDRKTFRTALDNLGLKLSASEFQQVLAGMDADGDGLVTAKEFSDRLKLAKKQARQQAASSPRPSPRKARPTASPSVEPEPEPELRKPELLRRMDAARGEALACVTPPPSPHSARGVSRRSNSKPRRTLSTSSTGSTGSTSSGQWFPSRAWVDVVQPPVFFEEERTKLVVASTKKSYATHLEDGMKRLCAKVLTRAQMFEAFRRLDVDGSGEVDFGEFRQALRELNVICNEQQIVSMFKYFDDDGGGLSLSLSLSLSL